MSTLTTTNAPSRALKEARATRAFLGLHWDLTRRYFAWDLVWLVYHILSALIMGYIGVSSGVTPDYVPAGQSFTAYLLIGAIMWSYLSVIFFIVADTIAMERWEGTLEYTFMAPVSRFTHLTGVALVGLLYSLIRTVFMVLILWWAFGLDLSRANWLASAVSLLAASVAMIGLSLCAAVMPLLSPEKGSQANHILSAVLLLASGVYYPLSALPGWLQQSAYVNPVYWALETQRDALLAGAPLSGMWSDIGWLIASGAIYLPLGYVTFIFAERYAKRVGLLKRAG
jgi:ABC-2 type transport system permease protein